MSTSLPMMPFHNGSLSLQPGINGFDVLLSEPLQTDTTQSTLLTAASRWAMLCSHGRFDGPVSCVGQYEEDGLIIRVMTPSHAPVNDEELKTLITIIETAADGMGREQARSAG